MSTTLRISGPMAALLSLTALLATTAPGLACPLRHRSVPPVVVAVLPVDKEPAKPDPVDAIKPPDGLVMLAKFKAEGVQIYECKLKKDNPKEYEWSLTAPDAVLKDDNGKKIGTHGAGPSWEFDGGKVTGVRPPKGMLPKEKTIPWLLIEAGEKEGKGTCTKVTYIQRVDTIGGAAPKQVDAGYAGTELRVPYTATYIFYGPK
jgi:hypothetical protein